MSQSLTHLWVTTRCGHHSRALLWCLWWVGRCLVSDQTRLAWSLLGTCNLRGIPGHVTSSLQVKFYFGRGRDWKLYIRNQSLKYNHQWQQSWTNQRKQKSLNINQRLCNSNYLTETTADRNFIWSKFLEICIYFEKNYEYASTASCNQISLTFYQIILSVLSYPSLRHIHIFSQAWALIF